MAPDTLYFSDRPDRIVGRMTTKKCVANWATGDDSFAQDPPNAVLSIQQVPLPQDITVELMHPRFDGPDLVYDVKVLDGKQEATGEASALFIDIVGRPRTPVSVAGARRRTVRRVLR